MQRKTDEAFLMVGDASNLCCLDLLMELSADVHPQRPRADLNRDRWIQSPECYPLHHEARYSNQLTSDFRFDIDQLQGFDVLA